MLLWLHGPHICIPPHMQHSDGHSVHAHQPRVALPLLLQVSDFGLSQVLDAVSGTVNGTHTFGALTHAAPEVVAGQALDKPADVFSIGVLLWELITSQVSV